MAPNVGYLEISNDGYPTLDEYAIILIQFMPVLAYVYGRSCYHMYHKQRIKNPKTQRWITTAPTEIVHVFVYIS